MISTKIFWGGKGPNDLGLSRKHIVEGTKVSATQADVLSCHDVSVFMTCLWYADELSSLVCVSCLVRASSLFAVCQT